VSIADRMRVALAALVGTISHALGRDHDIRVAEQYGEVDPRPHREDANGSQT